ncbi:MAG: macro domain-containing protein [Halobacteriovoraceae bacterium]|nr:macro domain-containing protein [Halobacteriovoraceae bacterium]
MIVEVTGDILLSEAECIVHGVAPNDHFLNGLAKSLREKFPEMYKSFRHFSHSNHPKEGTSWIWESEEGQKIVALFTQEHAPGHNSMPGKATTTYVNKSLKELKKFVEKKNIKTLAIPKISTGVGGLDWKEVQPLIQNHLEDVEELKVFVYEQYQAGTKANEE